MLGSDYSYRCSSRCSQTPSLFWLPLHVYNFRWKMRPQVKLLMHVRGMTTNDYAYALSECVYQSVPAVYQAALVQVHRQRLHTI